MQIQKIQISCPCPGSAEGSTKYVGEKRCRMLTGPHDYVYQPFLVSHIAELRSVQLTGAFPQLCLGAMTGLCHWTGDLFIRVI